MHDIVPSSSSSPFAVEKRKLSLLSTKTYQYSHCFRWVSKNGSQTLIRYISETISLISNSLHIGQNGESFSIIKLIIKRHNGSFFPGIILLYAQSIHVRHVGKYRISFDVEMVKGFDVATGSTQIMTATTVGLVRGYKQRMVITSASKQKHSLSSTIGKEKFLFWTKYKSFEHGNYCENEV